MYTGNLTRGQVFDGIPRNVRNITGMKRKFTHNRKYGVSHAQSKAYYQAVSKPRTSFVHRPIFTRGQASLPASQPRAVHKGGAEVKAVDGPQNEHTVTSAGLVFAINLVSEGSSFFNRIGRRIAMKSVEWKGVIYPVIVTNQNVSNGQLRFMIVYDRQPNGALAAVSDILLDTDNQGNTSTNNESGINLNNRDRFSVVMDKKMATPQYAFTTGTPNQITDTWPTDGAFQEGCGAQIHEFRKLHGIETHYKASSSPAVIGDIATGALLGVLISDANASGAWELDLTTRLRYFDD